MFLLFTERKYRTVLAIMNHAKVMKFVSFYTKEDYSLFLFLAEENSETRVKSTEKFILGKTEKTVWLRNIHKDTT